MAQRKDNNIEDSPRYPEQCKECGDEFLSCEHVEKGTCKQCKEKDTNHVILRGYCILCLFDGKKEWDDELEFVDEIFDGISLGLIRLGKQHKVLHPCTTKDKTVKILYKLYKVGYQLGQSS